MTLIDPNMKASNESKYGSKEQDVIAQAYGLSKYAGDFWCGWNAKKYIERFLRPNSSKANNPVDLAKALDYLQRMVEKNPIDKSPEELRKS